MNQIPEFYQKFEQKILLAVLNKMTNEKYILARMAG